MVASTKSTGSGHLIWPKGLSIEDVSLEFITLLNHALQVLSWQENLMSDEMPPYWMWHLEWEIEDWFKVLDTKRKEKNGEVVESVEPENQNLAFKEFEEQLRG